MERSRRTFCAWILLGLLGLLANAAGQETLPDSPGAVTATKHGRKDKHPLPPCPGAGGMPSLDPEAMSAAEIRQPCETAINPYQRFLNSETAVPLTPKQKGYLAYRDIVDPFNLLTIGANAAFTVGIDAHSAYGPGLKGFGRDVGYSFSQDATGEFIGTFAVCSLLHEDPHYHRLPTARPLHRVVHAIKRTVIAQHDDGSSMPNYENFITYPASAELANLYVPGVHGNGPSTVERILTGLATDPVNNLITEFVPDFARRVHIRVVFVQQILNQIASSPQL